MRPLFCLQVGKDQRAQAFLATLDTDPTIGSNVDCTSYYVSLLLRAMPGTVLTSLQRCRAAQATEKGPCLLASCTHVTALHHLSFVVGLVTSAPCLLHAECTTGASADQT